MPPKIATTRKRLSKKFNKSKKIRNRNYLLNRVADLNSLEMVQNKPCKPRL